MRSRFEIVPVAVSLLAGLLAAGLWLGCATQRAIEADRSYQGGLAQVARIDVRTQRDEPVSVHVTAYGALPDACTRIDRARQDRSVSGIDVTLTTRRESGDLCPPESTPFEMPIFLDIGGFPAGLYFVTVNGVQGTFEIPRNLRHRIDRSLPW